MGNRKMEYWIGWFHETHSGGEAIAIARAAEQLGFSGIALSDHVALPKQQQARHPMLGIPYDPRIPIIEPITTAATMAAVTETLRFMTYAYVMGMREPFSVAKQAGALADLSNNRFALGITPGWNSDEMALLGHDPATRGPRFTESIDVMRGLWAHDLFSYSGAHYQFEEVGIAPRPRQAPPILVGGHTPAAIRRAAEQAGWIGMNHSREELRPLLEQLSELSGGSALSFVIAAEPPSPEYLGALEDMGVTGVVFMPWPVMQAEPVPLDSKLAAMEDLADSL
jgi:probable F420-dependent oxidoreductase